MKTVKVTEELKTFLLKKKVWTKFKKNMLEYYKDFTDDDIYKAGPIKYILCCFVFKTKELDFWWNLHNEFINEQRNERKNKTIDRRT